MKLEGAKMMKRFKVRVLHLLDDGTHTVLREERWVTYAGAHRRALDLLDAMGGESELADFPGIPGNRIAVQLTENEQWETTKR